MTSYHRWRIVTAGGLNFRTGASTERRVIRVLKRGDSVETLYRVGTWILVRAGGDRGFVAAAHTAPHPHPYFAVAEAEMARGVFEVRGSGHNPRIIHYHATTTLKATKDEVPWCSSFACWCVEEAGLRSTKSAAARSWLSWGRAIEAPEVGCIVVLRRTGNPANGHVGFYAGREDGAVLVLGGNQSNQVNVSPYAESQVLGYRIPDQNAVQIKLAA